MSLPLNTAPGPSPDEESERHALISQDLLRHAWTELEKGDLLQASEKAWGATAHAIKSVAEKRRWFSEADWKLGRAAEIITAELDNQNVYRCYSLARDSHYNYYHHLYDSQTVGLAIAASSELVAILDETLAPDYVPPFVSDQTESKIRSLEQPTSDPDRERLANGRPPIEHRPPAIPPQSI